MGRRGPYCFPSLCCVYWALAIETEFDRIRPNSRGEIGFPAGRLGFPTDRIPAGRSVPGRIPNQAPRTKLPRGDWYRDWYPPTATGLFWGEWLRSVKKLLALWRYMGFAPFTQHVAYRGIASGCASSLLMRLHRTHWLRKTLVSRGLHQKWKWGQCLLKAVQGGRCLDWMSAWEGWRSFACVHDVT